MIGGSTGGVTAKEIVDNEAEENVVGFVAEEARSVLTFVIILRKKAFGEFAIGNVTGLFEAVHATIDADVGVAVGSDVCIKIVMIDNGLWEQRGVNAQVLWFREPMF